MKLTKTFSPEAFARALELWTWVDLENKVPVLATLFGDVFLRNADGYWFLDSLEGSLTKIATSRDDYKRTSSRGRHLELGRTLVGASKLLRGQDPSLAAEMEYHDELAEIRNRLVAAGEDDWAIQLLSAQRSATTSGEAIREISPIESRRRLINQVAASSTSSPSSGI